MLPSIAVGLDGQVSEELCASAATMANHLNAAAIFVYTRRGYMANFLSRCRPDCPIFAFTGASLHVAAEVLLRRGAILRLSLIAFVHIQVFHVP